MAELPVVAEQPPTAPVSNESLLLIWNLLENNGMRTGLLFKTSINKSVIKPLD